jgi:O-methyltransferase
MERINHFLYDLFPKFGKAYKRLIKRPITYSFCDVAIEADPLWNHMLKVDQQSVDQIKQACNSGDLLMSFHEAANLVWATRVTKDIFGEVAEVGSYSGASASLILESEPGDIRTVNLFDTFEGNPEVTIGIDKLSVGEIKGLHYSEVKARLANHSARLRFHVGIFPNTLSRLRSDVLFSLVNLDADTYSTTLSALQYFYPRMSKCGIILCHDYSSISCPGVRKAIDEFFFDKVEMVVPLWHTQALIIKS